MAVGDHIFIMKRVWNVNGMDEMFFLPTVLSKNDTNRLLMFPFTVLFYPLPKCPMPIETGSTGTSSWVAKYLKSVYTLYKLVLDRNLTQT